MYQNLIPQHSHSQTMIDDLTLQNQIRDLALASRSEPTDGWRTEELDPKLWNGWRKMIQGDRLEIAEYDLTAKVSQGDSPSDKPGDFI